MIIPECSKKEGVLLPIMNKDPSHLFKQIFWNRAAVQPIPTFLFKRTLAEEDLSSFPTGLYLVRIATQNTVRQKQIMLKGIITTQLL